MGDLRGKIALVTGGGQGLGKEIVIKLAGQGATVYAADINSTTVIAVEKELKSPRQKVKGVELNVADAASVVSVLNGIIATHERIDIVVNNAGIDVTKSIYDISAEEFERVIRVNLIGPFLVAKHAMMHMAAKKSGHIVNILSTASLRAWTETTAYHASKWGLRGLTQALFTEARRDNIKVTGVIAGGMKTPFILERFPEAAPNLQDPKNVADAVFYVLTQPAETVVPEIMVIPMKETSWP